MKILVIGEPEHLTETENKFGRQHTYARAEDHHDAEKFLTSNDLIFDFIIEDEPNQFDVYTDKDVTVFLNTCKISLGELAHMVNHDFRCRIFGFNGLPGFFNRTVLEISLIDKQSETELIRLCALLKTEYVVVDDRIGLVTPRVICMIINEAYYTVQEGTATREDIDLAMKLGTNYPFGPFEWCRRIGIRHVYELLEAIYEDTRDERYKICPLLKQEYLHLV
jgi:3-hydroxybutyryl-CoA dehydrogenase